MDRLAVMVDGHAGTGFQSDTREGTLLQHPAFASLDGSGANSLVNNYQIDSQSLDRLKRIGVYNYVDPVSRIKGGEDYAGEWIAAMAQVEITRRSIDFVERKEPANLWVLVQARASTVTAPVARMGDKMMREGLIALLTMLAMVALLWYIVVRRLRLSERMKRSVRSSQSEHSKSSGGSEITLELDR